jgi:hypothetical protein
MAGRKLKRYGLEDAAKALIIIGLLLNLLAWLIAAYYFGLSGGKVALFIVPFIFTCVSVLLLLVINYRYTLFEKYPYLINLPSLFYHLGEKNDTSKQSIAFSMIFTVHALILAAVGLMSILLTVSIGYSEQSNTVSPFLYSYLVVIAILIAAVFLQYRRIYLRLSK